MERYWPACWIDFWRSLHDSKNLMWVTFSALLQGAHMQTSTRTTWSMAQIITGYLHKYKSLQPHLRVPIKIVGRLRRLSCWCVTEPVRDSKDAGASNEEQCFQICITIPKKALKLFLCFSCRFGNPFILYLERTVTWDVLQKEILEKMQHLLRPGVFVQVHNILWHSLHTHAHRQLNVGKGLNRHISSSIFIFWGFFGVSLHDWQFKILIFPFYLPFMQTFKSASVQTI